MTVSNVCFCGLQPSEGGMPKTLDNLVFFMGRFGNDEDIHIELLQRFGSSYVFTSVKLLPTLHCEANIMYHQHHTQ